jgi:hypothetical protein
MKERVVDAFSSIGKEIIKIMEDRLMGIYPIQAARGAVESTVKIGGTPSWVGRRGEHLVEVLAACFSKREYARKAERIAMWAEKFGINDIRAGWWGEDKLGSDYEDPVFKTTLNLALASYGSRQLMTIITQLFWSEPGDLIMIEEPETSLHPEFQVLLQELFAEAVRDGRQIVYSTHSPFLILALSRVIGKGILSRDDIAIYHVEKGDRGTKVKQLRLNDRGFVSGWIPTRILLIRAIRRILELERAEAERSDRAKPSLSAIVEMLLRKGIKAYYAEDKK